MKELAGLDTPQRSYDKLNMPEFLRGTHQTLKIPPLFYEGTHDLLQRIKNGLEMFFSFR